jgi:hypothetical protein
MGFAQFKDPLAHFTYHGHPLHPQISVELHPTDESTFVASDDIGMYIYDLSVEEEDSSNQTEEEELPAQLLFIHWGSREFKKCIGIRKLYRVA